MKKREIIYQAEEFNNIKEMIYRSAEKYDELIAFRIKVNKNPIEYKDVSYKKMLEEINELGTAFYDMGLEKTRVAIIGKNRYEWVLTHLSVLMGGMISVPLDKDLQYEELERSLIRSKAKTIVFDSKLKDIILEIKKNDKTEVENYICMDEKEGFISVPELLEKGKELIKEGKTEYLNYEVDSDEMAILLFTSGTTDNSKAVMLSQRNIACNIYALQCVEDFRTTDTNIAFLPFHHIFGSTCIVMLLAYGVRTVFPDGLKYIKQNLNEYKVSVFVGVPVLIEAIFKTIMKEIDRTGKRKKFEFGLKLSRFLMKLHIDVRRKLFKDIIDALGGELRFLVSGGAPADKDVSRTFNDIGIRITQGYGLTETSPVVCAEDEKHIRFGSVGLPMINDELEVYNPDEDGIGEIRVKGPNIMLGYYEMEEETKKVLKDGWFYTGDLGYLDKDGYLYITGRDKNMIVLKNGKKVFPEELESLVNKLKYVSESMVFGLPDDEDKNDVKLSVKVVYDEEQCKGMDEEKIREEIWEQIKNLNTTFPKYKHIKNMILSKDELIKNSTKKVVRREEMKLILNQK